MFDLTKEPPITLQDATAVIAELYANGGRPRTTPIHVQTVRNWSTRGIKGVTLETASIGGRVVTSRESLSRFFAAVEEARTQLREEKQEAADHYRCRRRTTKHDTEIRRQLAERHGI